MEIEVLKRLRKLVGYAQSGTGDGFFVCGMKFGTTVVVRLVLHKTFPDVKKLGIVDGRNGKVPCFFVPESWKEIATAVALMVGLERSSCIAISHRHKRMDFRKLKKEIQEAESKGMTPFMVIATSWLFGRQYYL